MLNFMFTLILTLFGGDCTKFDLIIICDYSGSVRDNESVVARAVDVFSKQLYIGEEDTKFGIIVFNDSSELYLPLTTDTAIVTSTVDELYREVAGYSTNLSAALLGAHEEFKINGRPDVKKIVVLISDGEPNNKPQALDISKTLKMMNIEIFTLLVNTQDTNEEYMKQIASPNAYFSTNYQQLSNTLKYINFCL